MPLPSIVRSISVYRRSLKVARYAMADTSCSASLYRRLNSRSPCLAPKIQTSRLTKEDARLSLMTISRTSNGGSMSNAILIDAENRSISSFDAPNENRALKIFLNGAPKRLHRFPNGDLLIAAREPTATQSFRVGQSAPICGKAIVIGRRDEFGFFTHTLYSSTTISSLVRFIDVRRE
jgi:hypothetical protein